MNQKTSSDFERVFSTQLSRFMKPVIGFDLAGFVDYIGVPEEMHINEFLEPEYGKEAVTLINQLGGDKMAEAERRDAWVTEDDNDQSEPLKPSAIEKFKTGRPEGYDVRKDEVLKPRTKAWLVCVDSDKEDWGVVEDTHGDLLWVPGKGEVVGTWSVSAVDSLIHLSVETSLQALQDQAVVDWARHAEERKQRKAEKTTTRKKAKKEVVEQELVSPASVERKMAISRMRRMLRK